MLKTKTRKQHQHDLKEKRKAITDNKNNSSFDNALNDADEKTSVTVISLRLLCT